MPSRVWRYGVVGVALIVLAGGCGAAARHQTAPSTTRITVAPTTTLPGVQTSGPRTVLSPVGINVRAGARRSAPVIGTAAWGSVLTVLGHTAVRWGLVLGEGRQPYGMDQQRPDAQRRRRVPPLHLEHLHGAVSASLGPQGVSPDRGRFHLQLRDRLDCGNHGHHGVAAGGRPDGLRRSRPPDHGRVRRDQRSRHLCPRRLDFLRKPTCSRSG